MIKLLLKIYPPLFIAFLITWGYLAITISSRSIADTDKQGLYTSPVDDYLKTSITRYVDSCNEVRNNQLFLDSLNNKK